MNHVAYAPDLIEEAVLLAEDVTSREAREFRRERDSIYEIADQEARERCFQNLHLARFARLQLGAVIDEVLQEYPRIITALRACRAVRALTRQEEGADLVDTVGQASACSEPMLVLRLRPATIVDRNQLRLLLRRELMHVADMLDPEFGYERVLPASADGPASESLIRTRYRVLWDTSIDGRLMRAGVCDGSVRQRRQREFAAAFTMSGTALRSEFDRWFDGARPSHPEMVAFAIAPPGRAGAGRCPLCRFPVTALDARIDHAPESMLMVIEHQHPGWHRAEGLCPQCFDLYEVRHGEVCAS